MLTDVLKMEPMKVFVCCLLWLWIQVIPDILEKENGTTTTLLQYCEIQPIYCLLSSRYLVSCFDHAISDTGES